MFRLGIDLLSKEQTDLMIVTLKQKKYLLVFLFLLSILPWIVSDYTDQISPEKITSDLRFYEINTCKISIGEFLVSNSNVLYQDHYKLRFNNYSSIRCFGKITGIDQINHVFYISVGSNIILNLLLQTTFWLILISLIKKDTAEVKLSFKALFSILSSSILLTYGVLTEERFYSKMLFILELDRVSTYYQIFGYIFFTQFFSYFVILRRKDKLINFIPFTFLFIGLFNGFNLYFYISFFLTYGIRVFLDKKSKFDIYFIVYLSYSLFWLYQSINNFYYLKPDKIRGLTSTMYSFSSVLYWSLITIFSIYGLIRFFNKSSKNLDIKNIAYNFLIAGLGILTLGILSSSNPIFNFLTYYYFGLTKYGTDNQDLFGRNEWGEKIAWRGIFPSAETIGEFYALTIFLFLIIFINKENVKKSSYLLIIFPIIGLYTSNNKAAFFSLIVCLLLKVLKSYDLNRFLKYTLTLFSFLFLIFLIRFENFTLSLDFAGSNMVGSGYYIYGLDGLRSTAINYLFNLEDKNIFLFYIFYIIALISFYINRSELWGLFFARHNPDLNEVLFGTGPFNLARHYGEIKVQSTRSFLLPHSTILNLYLYFGILFTIIFVSYLLYKTYKRREQNYDLFLIGLFLILNIFKSDSLLYAPSLITYAIFFLIIINKSKKTFIVDIE